ncbi:hypothetical protein [Mycoplasma sp. OR1901]|uniref:hypothetical protein n=1 Tax=Mycoplasma sp. OR1901 TaxID=2742195 RepID=UPI0015820F26|nr:hypothetical protein [Mycoplasma sp. OR1901]QKT05401.1 hypothetical protein HTZ87_01650 [Mycoplasma sp. OR1901]
MKKMKFLLPLGSLIATPSLVISCSTNEQKSNSNIENASKNESEALVKLQNQKSELEKQLNEQNVKLKVLQTTIESKNTEISNLNNTISNKDAKIAEIIKGSAIQLATELFNESVRKLNSLKVTDDLSNFEELKTKFELSTKTYEEVNTTIDKLIKSQNIENMSYDKVLAAIVALENGLNMKKDELKTILKEIKLKFAKQANELIESKSGAKSYSDILKEHLINHLIELESSESRFPDDNYLIKLIELINNSLVKFKQFEEAKNKRDKDYEEFSQSNNLFASTLRDLIEKAKENIELPKAREFIKSATLKYQEVETKVVELLTTYNYKDSSKLFKDAKSTLEEEYKKIDIK